jgi:chromosome segregation ATPase
MKLRIAVAAMILVAVPLPGLAQTDQSESRALDAILTELKGIHEDLRVMRTMQVLLTELAAKQTVVNQDQERVDRARSGLAQIQIDQRRTASDLERTQDKLDNTSSSEEQKPLADEVERLKGNVAALKVQEQSRETALDEAQQRLRDAQDDLGAIQEQLNTLTKKMGSLQN